MKNYKINSILNIEKLRVVGALMLERVRQKLSNFKSKISSLVEKHQLFSVSKNNIKRYLVAILILSVAIIAINSSLATTVPVKSIEIKSESLDYDKSEQGAWKVTKSATWTDRNKARITFDVDTIEKIPDKDRRIILILDCSESMNNVDFKKLKTNLYNTLSNLSSDKKTNTVAYAEFNDTVTTKIDYTTSLSDIKSAVNNATATGGSSYYEALQQVDTFLKNHTKVDTENVTTIFITSGSPTVDTPNEVSQYTYLKEQYPYLEIKAIQYGLGDEVLESVKNISDKQYIAKEENLARILYNTIFGVMEYDNFSITDKINANYFNVDSVLTTDGEALINGESINWNITNSRFITGTKKQLNIDISVKDDATINATDLCETNSEEAIISKLDDISENITSTLTPILSAGHTVTYDINSPPTCTPTFTPTSENHFVFEQVSFSKEVPTCLGYQFKGWQIINDNVTGANSEGFIMPDEDVIVKALWTNLSLNKSNDGKVTEQATLYNVIKYEATLGGLAKEYTGNHQDSLTGTGNKKIYYYHADTDAEGEILTHYKNNVIFAGMCWRMIRTTDTGGVKIMYNGVPGEDGSCLEPGITSGVRGTTIGTFDEVTDEYYYGTDYEYDSVTSTYKLSGDTFHSTAAFDDKILNTYTCKKENLDDTCENLFFVIGEVTLFSIPIPIYEEIGPLQHNSIGLSLYNMIGVYLTLEESNTIMYPSTVGYMYNPNYSITTFLTTSEKVLSTSEPLTGTYYSSSYATSGDKYRLRLPSKLSSSSDYSKMVGKYTVWSLSMLGTNEKMGYVVGTANSKIYYIEMLYPNNLDYYNYTYAYGDSYTDNSDGTYTINNSTTFKREEWMSNYSKVKNKYLCKPNSNNKCDTISYVTDSTKEKYDALTVAGVVKHASSYTYENGMYKLSDDATTKWDIVENETTNVDNKHYACYSEINENNECEKIIYIYNFDGKTVSGIVLENGQTIETIVKELFQDSEKVNQKDSIAKTTVENWYRKKLLAYTDYIEDIIYCGNRNITDLGGLNSSGGKIKIPLKFNEYTLQGDLSCPNVFDKFSVNNDKAKLNYPVGLPTGNEIDLLGNKYAPNQIYPYYLMSPTKISDSPYIRITNDEGKYEETSTNQMYVGEVIFTLKPVISLKPNTKYSKGDGSMENPYIVDMSE